MIVTNFTLFSKFLITIAIMFFTFFTLLLFYLYQCITWESVPCADILACCATPSPKFLVEKAVSPSGIIQAAKSGTKFRHFKATMLAAIRYPAEKNEFCNYPAIVCSLAVIAVRFSTCMQSTMSKSNST